MDQALDPEYLCRQRRKRAAVIGALLLAFAAGAWGINRVVVPSVRTQDLHLATVHRGAIANTIGASGIVIPVHEEQIPSPTPSRIAKVLAKPGQEVKEGDILLQLDERATRLEIDRLKEQLAQQENHIVSLSQEMEQKRKQLVSAIELLELDLQSARVKWQSYQAYRSSGAISGNDMLAAELNVKRAEIQLRQQRGMIEDVRRSTATAIDGARLQKDILKKQLEQQEHLLAQLTVRAPFAGVVTWLAEEEGAAVANGQLVARVSELHNFRIEATLSDFHARSLAPGQAVRVEQAGQVLSGHVHTVLPEIQNGSMKLLVALDQPAHPSLRNKMRVDVQIVTAKKNEALIVDAGAAFNGRGRQSGYVADGDQIRRVWLDIGDSDGKSVEILGGAGEGQRLVISSLQTFKEREMLRVAQ